MILFSNDTAMGEAEEEVAAEDEPADDLSQVIRDAQRECESEKEKIKFERMLEDHKKLLYPTCDAGLRFPVDDVTEPCTTCELHILKGNSTIKVAIGLVNPIDRTKTPMIHGNIIQDATISVDKAKKGFSDLSLDIPRGDGEKTLGEAEKTFILWRKRYMIIPGMSPPPPPELPHHRCG